MGYDSLTVDNTIDAQILMHMERSELSEYYDELFHVTANYDASTKSVVIGSHKFKLYSRKRKVKALIKSLPSEKGFSFFGKLFEYNGKLEFIIDHESWLEKAIRL